MHSSYYNSFNPDNLSWELNEKDPMIIDVRYNGIKVMGISMCEAVESVGRTHIMKHVRICDSTPWLKKWHDEMMDAEVDILKGESHNFKSNK